MERSLRLVIASASLSLLVVAPRVVEAQLDRSVLIDGNLVFRVGPSGQLSAEARADQAEAQLTTILGTNIELEPQIRRFVL